MLARAHIRPARAALAPRRTPGGFTAAGAEPLRAAAGVAHAGGGVLAWTAPVFERGAAPAPRFAVEGTLSTSPAEPRGPSRGVLLTLDRSPGVAAWFADGAALDGRTASAPPTTARVAPSVEAPLASLPGDPTAAVRIAPAIELPGGRGGRVPGPLGLTPFFPARCAQTALGLERFPAALRAQPPGRDARRRSAGSVRARRRAPSLDPCNAAGRRPGASRCGRGRRFVSSRYRPRTGCDRAPAGAWPHFGHSPRARRSAVLRRNRSRSRVRRTFGSL